MEEKTFVQDEISLKELIFRVREWFKYFIAQWKTIFLFGLIGIALGVTFSVIKKPIYTATLTFALEDEKSGGGLSNALGLASSFGLDVDGGGGSIFSGSNLTELFKSRTMVEQTLLSPVKVNGETISLAEMYILDNGLREKWNDNPKFKDIQFLPKKERNYFTRAHDSILGSIYKELSKSSLLVSQKDKKVSIITMDVSSNDELFSLYFCEALAKKVGEFYVTTKSKKARMNMEILQRQTDSIRSELNSAITGVAIANDNNFMLNPALNVRRTPSAKKQIDVQANTVILTELVKQAELAKVTLRKETPLIQIIDRPILPLNKEKFGLIKGVLFGSVIGGFLALIFLSFRRVLRNIMY